MLRLLTVALAACGALAGCAASASTTTPLASLNAAQVGSRLLGGVLSPPDIEPDTVLTDTAGHRYDIVRRGAGKVTLVFFGYTRCPDVCPTTMADIAEALRQSSAAVRRDVTVVFITVDPRHDPRRRLRGWLDRFSPAFVGLRGSPADIVAAQRAARLPVSRVDRSGKTIEHSAEILAYTPDHMAHVIYFDGPSTIDDLRHDLPILTRAAAYGS